VFLHRHPVGFTVPISRIESSFGPGLCRLLSRSGAYARRGAGVLGRMLVKYLLGIVSFLTVPARKDRRAIHDLSADTIVIEA
jgi:hypothetical protein